MKNPKPSNVVRLPTRRSSTVPAPTVDEAWPDVSRAVIDGEQVLPTPQIPKDILGPFWSAFAQSVAEGTGSRVDYAIGPLLAIAGGLICCARFAPGYNETHGEPAALWLWIVDHPSFGKSRALRAFIGDALLHKVKLHAQGKGFARRLELWEEENEAAAKAKGISADRAPRFRKNGKLIGQYTAEKKPVARRITASNITVEAIRALGELNPRGFLIVKPELTELLHNTTRNAKGGDDISTYLELFDRSGALEHDRIGTPDTPGIQEEVGGADAVAGILGTIQPEILRDMLKVKKDNGLFSRPLYMWADPLPPRRIQGVKPADYAGAVRALNKLVDLDFNADDTDEDRRVPNSKKSADLLFAFQQELHELGSRAKGLYRSSLGRGMAHAMRLALIIEFMRWSGRVAAGKKEAEPNEVSVESTQDAIDLMRDYFLPMTRKVFGNVVKDDREKIIRGIIQYIRLHPDVAEFTTRQVQTGKGWENCKNQPVDDIKAALRVVRSLGLIRRKVLEETGRKQPDMWEVSPKIRENGE